MGAPGTLLGVFDDVPLFDASGTLLPGDALILYTDGLLGKKETEAFSERGPFKGGLPKMAREASHANRASSTMTRKWMAKEPLPDRGSSPCGE